MTAVFEQCTVHPGNAGTTVCGAQQHRFSFPRKIDYVSIVYRVCPPSSEAPVLPFGPNAIIAQVDTQDGPAASEHGR